MNEARRTWTLTSLACAAMRSSHQVIWQLDRCQSGRRKHYSRVRRLSQGQAVEVGYGQTRRCARHLLPCPTPDGTVWLLIVYAKAKVDNLLASFLAQLKKKVEDAI